MATNKMIIEERSRDIGDFLVGRLLPFRKKRQVGPFTFIDHMGPSELGPKHYMDVDQHPHIGLCTLTYLLEGEVEHRDSTGAQQIIRPGDVGLMSSGRGVSHTERTPLALRDARFTLHGYQVWLALPKEKEEMEPRWDFVSANELPRVCRDGMSMTVVAGEAYGLTSPLPVHSPLFMVDILADQDTVLDIHAQLKGEIALVVTEGKITSGSDIIEQGQMMISKTEDECRVELLKGTRLLVFGGEALPEERFMHWNFVSSSKDRLKQAADDWKHRRFPVVEGDDTYIPLPGS